MSDVTVDHTGITRTEDGTIAPSPTSETTTTPSPETTPADAPSTSKPSLLNQQSPPADQAKPDGKEADGEKDAKEAGKAPEAYADYKVPDGFTLDAEVKGKADALFKGMGLSQEQAQSLVDFYTEHTLEAFQAPYNAFAEMSEKWSKDSLEHPDLRGKLGPGKEVTVRIAKLLDGLGDPALSRDFRNVMDITAAGNHPAFIRVLNNLAQRLTEGTHVAGNGPARAGQIEPGRTERPSAARSLWPNLPSSEQG